jgi:hypothetical protein
MPNMPMPEPESLFMRARSVSGVSAMRVDEVTRDLPPRGVSEKKLGPPPKLKSRCRDGVDVTSNGASSIRGVENRSCAGAGVEGVAPGGPSSV